MNFTNAANYSVEVTRTYGGNWNVDIYLIGDADHLSRLVYTEQFNGYTHSGEMAKATAKVNYIGLATERLRQA